MAIVGMALLAVAVTGVATLIFDVVVGRAAAITGAVLTFALLTALWAILPLASRGPSTNDEEPQTLLRGFLVLMGVYGTGTGVAVGAARALGRPAPDRLTPFQLAELTIATHKISRLIAKDPVTSPLRAPFTTFAGTSAPSELSEEVRGHGLQHSVGELITCPMCLAQWVATGLTAGLTLAPTATRLVIQVFTVVAGADFLQHLYAGLEQKT